jgi:hypothetical protein
MIPFQFKANGYVVIILSLVLFLSTIFNFPSISPFTDAWIEAIRWIGLGGLVLIAISKERIETQEIELVRFRSFFRMFFSGLMVVVVYSLSNLLFISNEISIEKILGYLNDYDLLKFSILFLALHLFSFRRELRKMLKRS